MERPERDDLIAELRALADEGRRLSRRARGSSSDWAALITVNIFGADPADLDDDVVIWEIRVRNALSDDPAKLAAFEVDPPGGFPAGPYPALRRLAFRRRSLDAVLKAY